ncbi:thiopurine S-methyltransferase [Gayadomonas joobiniege]|uniref:thiopurine S-methyltransferase n=1 Tax=Gayadomonas joobiniege TaxID=1234606 RepID=UPI000376393E|nr:thiopurine S-methyltransferase [Gayadomonas joobiniege]
MQAEFWHNKWQQKQIGFHLAQSNPLLLKHFHTLALAKNSRVFVPLCGKTLDIHWLLAKGHQVVGCELSEIAVRELFNELKLEPECRDMGNIKHFYANNLDIFVGDIFKLTKQQLGQVDAIYDRAAYVALPETTRAKYAAHLTELSQQAPQLLIYFQYDQSQLEGPPFAISDSEIKNNYQSNYQINWLDRPAIAGGFKGVPATEVVCHLTAT